MSETEESLICIDLGTTNTRVLRVGGDGGVLAKAHAQVGVRDTAREGSPALLRSTLQRLIAEVAQGGAGIPVIAAGMITSSLGLKEIPHLPSPAGLAEIAAGTKAYEFPDVCAMPIWLVPGVRCGDWFNHDPVVIARIDMMRGEETFCIGLDSLGLADRPATVLNLGSHWKTIQMDAAGRVVRSFTSLAGEMIHAVQTTTILSSALSAERPEELDRRWVFEGMREQRGAGLGRALFCVRLLQLSGKTTAEERLAYAIGAFIAADMEALVSAGMIGAGRRLMIAGNKAVTGAWKAALAGVDVTGVSLSEEDVERAMIAGLTRIHEKISNTPRRQLSPPPGLG
jgi:2-dehydro-3-deoxygalactonokinase